ncbi:hypothetical protein [Spirillospora sp. CA-294931]|uniref:hypothetical protein n=1 Tax=Spirillospora sp. CA-294931 TaxID=3240042 RepID=UPI003D950202
MGDFFARRILDTGRLPLFCFFVAFILTFVLTRVNVRLIRAEARFWFRNITAGDVHIHHVVFGVVLMLIGGISSLVITTDGDWRVALAAVIFGIGSALVLDEFALILHLSDVYWTEKGRASVDAVFVAVAVTGLLLMGIHPLGLTDLAIGPGETDRTAVLAAYVTTVVLSLGLAVVTLLKGKIWTGLIGMFIPFLLIAGALRLARPASPWARWRYKNGSSKIPRAERREARYRRPMIRAKIWVQEFIAGRPDLHPPELLKPKNKTPK